MGENLVKDNGVYKLLVPLKLLGSRLENEEMVAELRLRELVEHLGLAYIQNILAQILRSFLGEHLNPAEHKLAILREQDFNVKNCHAFGNQIYGQFHYCTLDSCYELNSW